MKTCASVFAIALTCSSAVAQTVPTIDQLVSLRRVGSPVISPDAQRVAYTVRETNWEENAYETEIWLADVGTGSARQLTNAKKSSSQPAWSPDGRTLAFVSDRTDKRQVYLIDPAGGEAEALTSQEDGVSGFFWSPDGRQIAFTATDPKPQAVKDRDKKYGEFEVVGEDPLMTHLYVVDVASRKVRKLTDGAFSVGSGDWSPDGREIAFDFRVNPDPGSSAAADISIVSVADGKIRALVSQEGPDSGPHWSPDGRQILFETAMGNRDYYSYSNALLAVVPSSGGAIQVLSRDFDEVPSIVGWTSQGIYFSASHRTWACLYRLDPATRQVTRLAPADEWIGSGFTLSRDSTMVAFVASDARSYPEVYAAPIKTMQPRKLTDLGKQTDGWIKGTHEVISWKSQDGTTIEGVLHKPAGFEAGRRYPLLVVIHGGPTGVSRPTPFSSTSSYPIDIWLTKGALVLEPNYRGSAGYGEKFRSLNIRNLGIGDAWDVVSGIDHLVELGIADNDRVGTMGWSQGGYISAFLTTHDSARFKAVSVGAGISDWMTYYVNTDIHPFTRQYLKATPWDDPEIYKKTSPITYIKNAKAPTLIQHGEKDPRVPIPNAYELYQGLVDQKVPAKLIVYKGFGHGLTKPKANRAAMEHNLEWFGQYIFETK
ncbi:MAG TPA: S9 family peptidase [Vicinamibacterales bacterium]